MAEGPKYWPWERGAAGGYWEDTSPIVALPRPAIPAWYDAATGPPNPHYRQGPVGEWENWWGGCECEGAGEVYEG